MLRAKEKKERVTVTLTKKQHTELLQFAYVLDCSNSKVIAMALDYFAGRGLVDPRAKTPSPDFSSPL